MPRILRAVTAAYEASAAERVEEGGEKNSRKPEGLRLIDGEKNSELSFSRNVMK